MDGTDGSIYVPIGRSYDGHDWENLAGLEVSNIQFTCTEHNIFSNHCQVYLANPPAAGTEIRSLRRSFLKSQVATVPSAAALTINRSVLVPTSMSEMGA